MCSEPVFLHSGPTYAYYYVEILLVNSGNASGVFNIDVYDEYMEQLKFAEFKKIDRGRGAVGWLVVVLFPVANLIKTGFKIDKKLF